MVDDRAVQGCPLKSESQLLAALFPSHSLPKRHFEFIFMAVARLHLMFWHVDRHFFILIAISFDRSVFFSPHLFIYVGASPIVQTWRPEVSL